MKVYFLLILHVYDRATGNSLPYLLRPGWWYFYHLESVGCLGSRKEQQQLYFLKMVLSQSDTCQFSSCFINQSILWRHEMCSMSWGQGNSIWLCDQKKRYQRPIAKDKSISRKAERSILSIFIYLYCLQSFSL